MVGYSEPCPCCGNKRRRPALERWDSSPASCSAAARSPPPVKFARSASAPSPSAVALATAIRATTPTAAPPAPLAPASTSSDLPAQAPSENVPGGPPLPLPQDSLPDPTPPTTSIPAPAVAKQEVTEKKDEEGAKELKEGEKERKEMAMVSGEVEVRINFKCCKCGNSKAVVFPSTDSH